MIATSPILLKKYISVGGDSVIGSRLSPETEEEDVSLTSSLEQFHIEPEYELAKVLIRTDLRTVHLPLAKEVSGIVQRRIYASAGMAKTTTQGSADIVIGVSEPTFKPT